MCMHVCIGTWLTVSQSGVTVDVNVEDQVCILKYVE